MRTADAMFRGWTGISLLPLLLIHAAVDGRNLCHPPAAFGVFERHHLAARPVEVIRDKGYLLIHRMEGLPCTRGSLSGRISSAAVARRIEPSRCSVPSASR